MMSTATATAIPESQDSVKINEPYQTKGTVIWFNRVKGYGFIHCDKRGHKVFVYHLNISMDGFRYLESDEEVEFTVMSTNKGPAAFDVKRVHELVT